MKSTICDTCRETVDDYENRAQLDYAEFHDTAICRGCAEAEREDESEDYKAYGNRWSFMRILEKAYLVKECDLVAEIQIFTDLGQSPKWEDIEAENQWCIIQAMVKVGVEPMWENES